MALIPTRRWVIALVVAGVILVEVGCGVEPSPPPPSPPQLYQFPWPPPAASAKEVVPKTLIERGTGVGFLKDVDELLRSALDKNGYAEKSYYAVPKGFALVTRLEQIEPDGRSKGPPERWSPDAPRLSPVFSFGEYLRALFTAPPGYYRVIVFIVTDVPFNQLDVEVTADEASDWLRGGLNVLPEPIGTQLYNPKVATTALIYEFERQQGEEPDILLPSRLDAHAHLVGSGIWNALGGI